MTHANTVAAIIAGLALFEGDTHVPLTEEETKAIARAIARSGKNKGRLKSRAPSRWDPPLATAAWLAIQPNPFKTGVGAILMIADEHRPFWERLSAVPWPSVLDADRAALEGLGVW